MGYRSRVDDWTDEASEFKSNQDVISYKQVHDMLDDIENQVNTILDMMKSVDEKGFGVLDECIDDLERLSKDLY